jgi:hypothetical protein
MLEGRLLPSSTPLSSIAFPLPPPSAEVRSLQTPGLIVQDPYHVALAVTDSNGKTEFIYASESADRVVVTLGDDSAVIADAGSGLLAPVSVHLADLNGDGIDDLIVCDRAADRVFIYLGLGNGRFGSELNGGQGLYTGTAPVAAAVAAENGLPAELAVANQGSNDVAIFQVWKKGAAWGLVEKQRIPVGQAPTAVILADCSGEGHLDLVTTNGGDNTVSILRGVAGGLFDDRSPRVLHTGNQPIACLLADFLSDGKLDLATVNQGSNDVTLFADVASGLGGVQTIPTGGTAPVAALALGVNGRTDLVVANNSDGRLSLLTSTAGQLHLDQVLQEQPGLHPTALADAGLGSLSFYVMNEGQQSATLMSFAAPAAAAPAAQQSAALVEEKTAAPEERLAAEREPVDLRSLDVTGVALVPTVVMISAAGQQAGQGAHAGGDEEGTPAATAVSAPQAEGLAASFFLLPELEKTNMAAGPSGVVPMGPPDEQAGVQRFILGTDEVPAPRIDPAGAGEQASAVPDPSPPAPLPEAERGEQDRTSAEQTPVTPTVHHHSPPSPKRRGGAGGWGERDTPWPRTLLLGLALAHSALLARNIVRPGEPSGVRMIVCPPPPAPQPGG